MPACARGGLGLRGRRHRAVERRGRAGQGERANVQRSRASAGLMGLSCVAVVAGRGPHPRRRKRATHLRSRRRGGGSDPGRACPRAWAYKGGGGAGRGVQDSGRMPRPLMGGRKQQSGA